jgi:uroporphyrinogen decarboxylase
MGPAMSATDERRSAKLTKVERVRRALRSADLDHPPCAFWTHFPGIDLDPETLAAGMTAFARKLDLDFVKAMPNGCYCVEDWGAVADHSRVSEGGVSQVVRPGVSAPEDWRKIGKLPVTEGAYGRELQHLSRLIAALGPEVPVLATVFSPLTVAHKLAGPALVRDFAVVPQSVLDALEAIAATTVEFVRQVLALGCAGIFFAVQDATGDPFDDKAYAVFGEPFDRRVLSAAAAAWFNLVHMHGDQVLFDRLSAYPVTALNWHVGETEPSVAAYRQSGGTLPIVGGIRRDALTARDWDGVTSDIAAALDGTRGQGLLLSPGCVIRHPVDLDFLDRVVRHIRVQASSPGKSRH